MGTSFYEEMQQQTTDPDTITYSPAKPASDNTWLWIIGGAILLFILLGRN